MKTIYCLTEWTIDAKKTNCQYFMTIDGIAEWLNELPSNHKFFTVDRDVKGEYDIAADNLDYIFKSAKEHGNAASFVIEIGTIHPVTVVYKLSTINVID